MRNCKYCGDFMPKEKLRRCRIDRPADADPYDGYVYRPAGPRICRPKGLVPEPNLVGELAKSYGNVRGKDRKKLNIQWTDPEVVMEFPGSKGELKLCRLTHPKDIAILGAMEGHCAGTHFVWACEEQIWHFLTLIDNKNVPHTTIHAKNLEWRGKKHPRDSKSFPFPVTGGEAPDPVEGFNSYYPSRQDVEAYCLLYNKDFPAPGTYGPFEYKSHAYGEGPDPRFPNSIKLPNDAEICVISWSGKGQGVEYERDAVGNLVRDAKGNPKPKPGKYASYVEKWYNENKTDNKVPAMARRY